MITKCYIETFENFVYMLNNSEYMYIERIPEDGNIVPEIYGLILSMDLNKHEKFALCLRDNNEHINPEQFKNIIIQRALNDNTRVNLYSMADTLNVYRYLNKEHLRCFVLDKTFINFK